MPKNKGTHRENLFKICLFCQKKPKTAIEIKGAIKGKITSSFPEFQANDNRFPKVICNSCRHKVCYPKDQNGSVQFPDYLPYNPVNVGEDGSCDCSLCRLVQRRQSKVPAKKIKKTKQKTEKVTQNQCAKCLNPIKRGAPHKCDVKNLLNNLVDTIKKHWQDKAFQQIAASLIKTILGNESVSSNSELKLSQLKGKALKIIANPKSEKQKKISKEIMCSLQVALNLSENQTLKAAKALSNGSRKVIEANLIKDLNTRSHMLDQFFECVEFDFITETTKGVKHTTQKVIVCKNLALFIKFILEKRGVTANYHYKFGIDGGGKFLKICLSIQSKAVALHRGDRKKKTAGFRDSGVKKLFIIAIAQNTQENHDNIKLIWDKLRINDFLTKSAGGTVTTDLKVANILFGLMNHASSHPCTWCLAKKKLLEVAADMRTISRCNQNFNHYNDLKRVKKNAQKFENCVNMPIIQSDEELILRILPPPELHLLIGTTNHMYNHMLEEFPVIAESWAKQCYVYRVDVYRGTLGFEGNHCKILINHVDKLRALCNKYDIECLKFVEAFDGLKKVVDSCFSIVLEPNFETCIDNFQKNYKELNISVTSKVHAIFFHVKQFCKTFGFGLGFFSEQAFESVHHDFQKTWQDFKVLDENPNYGIKLLRAVCVYNCRHL